MDLNFGKCCGSKKVCGFSIEICSVFGDLECSDEFGNCCRRSHGGRLCFLLTRVLVLSTET